MFLLLWTCVCVCACMRVCVCGCPEAIPSKTDILQKERQGQASREHITPMPTPSQTSETPGGLKWRPTIPKKIVDAANRTKQGHQHILRHKSRCSRRFQHPPRRLSVGSFTPGRVGLGVLHMAGGGVGGGVGDWVSVGSYSTRHDGYQRETTRRQACLSGSPLCHSHWHRRSLN